MLYLWNKINKAVLGVFGEGVVEQYFKEQGIEFWKLSRDFPSLLGNPEVPLRVREVLEELRNEELKVTLLGREWKLSEILQDTSLSDEEKERIKRTVEVKLIEGAPDYLTHNPDEEEMYAWEFVEVKFGFSTLSTEQRRVLAKLSRKIPCSVCLVVIRREGVEIAKVPVSEHLTIGGGDTNLTSFSSSSYVSPIPSEAVEMVSRVRDSGNKNEVGRNK